MGVAKSTIGGNPYIGAFASASDSRILVGMSLTANEEKILRENLDVDVIRVAVDGSDLVGIYAVMNSRGLLLPAMTRADEIRRIKQELPDMNIGILDTDLNALKNNILANDRIAIVNPEYSPAEIKRIEEILGVEAVKMQIGGFATVGANNIMTDKGIVMNNHATEREADEVMKLMANVSQTTANLGSPNIGLCAVANSKGMVVGSQTTGYEIARMAEGLEL